MSFFFNTRYPEPSLKIRNSLYYKIVDHYNLDKNEINKEVLEIINDYMMHSILVEPDTYGDARYKVVEYILSIKTQVLIDIFYNGLISNQYFEKFNKLLDKNIKPPTETKFTTGFWKEYYIIYRHNDTLSKSYNNYEGGKSYKKTDQKKMIAGRERVIYVNSRRKQFIKMKGQFVAVSSLRP